MTAFFTSSVRIPGVKEDVTEIIMNLKSLAIKNTSETDEPKTAYIEFEGEGVVTASRYPGRPGYRDHESGDSNRNPERRGRQQALHGTYHHQEAGAM